MANTDRPMGAIPMRHLTGAPYNGQFNEYDVDSSNGTAIFVGDFIQTEADGNVAPATAGTGNELLGACVGVKWVSAESTNYLAASTAGTIYVADAPDLVFNVQEDDGGTALTVAARGANVAIIKGAGSTSTGYSAHELDQDSVTVATEQLRLIRLVPVEGNAYGDNANWEVTINEHAYKQAVGI